MTEESAQYSKPYQPQQPAVQPAQQQTVQQPAAAQQPNPQIAGLEQLVGMKHQILQTAHAQNRQFPIPNNLATMLKASIEYHKVSIMLAEAMLGDIEGPGNGTA